MKISLKLTALFIAAAFPCAAFADILGAKLPSAFQLQNVPVAFAILLLGLTLIGDYSRRGRTLKLEVVGGSTAKKARGFTHRLAA
ncbi:MAG: hypothetical protein ABIZ04_03715 [Opitutus sp.]